MIKLKQERKGQNGNIFFGKSFGSECDFTRGLFNNKKTKGGFMSSRFQNQDGYLETINNKLYVVSWYKLDIQESFEDEQGYYYQVLSGWEDIIGRYWFQLEKENEDGGCFGFVQAHCAEFGIFDVNEFENHKPKVWKLKKSSLKYSGVREKPKEWEKLKTGGV